MRDKTYMVMQANKKNQTFYNFRITFIITFMRLESVSVCFVFALILIFLPLAVCFLSFLSAWASGNYFAGLPSKGKSNEAKKQIVEVVLSSFEKEKKNRLLWLWDIHDTFKHNRVRFTVDEMVKQIIIIFAWQLNEFRENGIAYVCN